MENNIYVFPILKKYQTKGKVDIDAIPKSEIEEFAHHYMAQLIQQLDRHGFKLDKKFFQDFELTSESFKSALLRSVGKHHPIQDYVDSLYELAMLPDED